MKFIAVLSYGKLSLMELFRLQQAAELKFEIQFHSSTFAILACSDETAKKIASRGGGIFKLGKICGSSITDLLDCIALPDRPKFNWTVSGYDCNGEIFEDTKTTFAEHLKGSSLGKSRFIQPDSLDRVVELKISDLVDNVLKGNAQREEGLDVVVACRAHERYYGYTQYVSDVAGFKERDFGRPYKDPTVTMSPRLARTLVNLCGVRQGGTILDPFCGLGTVLQEALVLGYNVVGVEISSAEATRCRENVNWVANKFQISTKLSHSVIRGDAMLMDSSKLPQVDAIATEPILVPKLMKNQTAERSEEILKDSAKKYREAFRAFSNILPKNGIVSIVVPDLVDDQGKPHTMDLTNLALEWGFLTMCSNSSGFENPCLVPTSKKKIIHRNVYLMKRGPKAV